MQKNEKASRSRQNFNISNVGYYETCYNNRSTRKLVIGKWQILSNTQKDPYLNQASQTEKYLLKFSYPKKSRNRKFQTPKDPSIIPVTRNPEYPTPLGTESYSCLPVDPLLLECGTKQESGKKIRRMRGLSRPPSQPHPLAVFLSAHISFPTKKKITLVSQPVNTQQVSTKEIDYRTGANFFALFSTSLRSGLGARDTRNAWRTSSAGYKRN